MMEHWCTILKCWFDVSAVKADNISSRDVRTLEQDQKIQMSNVYCLLYYLVDMVRET